jgi:serine/threonine protein kinase
LDDAERLAAKLDAWQAAQAGEGPLTPEDLCRDCPDLLPEVLRQVAVLRRFEALRVGEDEGTDEYRPAGADTSHDPNSTGTPVPTTPRIIATPLVGGEFGGFRIVALLGEGGMGRVYRAEDPQLSREVALKVMKPAVAAKPESRVRFLREARAMAAVHHDNVAPIFQVGEVDGVPFLAMPLLRGESLAALLKREGALPPADVLRIGREAAAGLVAVHARGLIHRDIKPTNIWLETLPDDSGTAPPRWRVKLLDFGLAREQSESDAVTQEGVVLGSPAYMSPEQTDGQPLDPRSDLFSLGSVLYECATGKRSFQGKTFTAILAAVAGHHPPPAHEVNPRVPKELSALVGRLQAKSPAERPPSAHSAAEWIDGIEMGPAPVTRSQPVKRQSSGPSRRRSRRFSVGCSISVTMAAMLLFSVGWWAWHRGSPSPRESYVRQQYREDLDRRLGERLATAGTPKKGVEALAEFAGELQRDAERLAQAYDRNLVLDVLSQFYAEVLRERLLPYARQLPQADRATVLNPVVERLTTAASHLERLAAAQAAHFKPLGAMAGAARETARDLEALVAG